MRQHDESSPRVSSAEPGISRRRTTSRAGLLWTPAQCTAARGQGQQVKQNACENRIGRQSPSVHEGVIPLQHSPPPIRFVGTSYVNSFLEHSLKKRGTP